jgi:hypothetical protein
MSIRGQLAGGATQEQSHSKRGIRISRSAWRWQLAHVLIRRGDHRDRPLGDAMLISLLRITRLSRFTP